MTDSLDTLTDDELEFLIQAPETGSAVEAPELEESQHGATMRGDIEQIGLADILQTLALSKMEGVLRVCNPLETRHLYCADGYIRPIMPAWTRRRRLLARIIQAGLVEAQDLRQIISQSRGAPVVLERLLVEAGLVCADDLEAAANVIIDEELFSLFTWRHGTFDFFRSEQAARALGDSFGDAPEYEIHSLLLEVARRSDEWALILNTLGSLEEVPTRSSARRAPESLSPEQRAIWASADGQSTYRQLAERTTLDLFDFGRAAASLCAAGELRNVSDNELLDVAETYAHNGDERRAAVTLQAMLERNQRPDADVTLRVAAIYEHVGARRKALAALLAAAQRTESRDDALRLAHAAHDIEPADVATLHFLRSVLVASGADAPAEEVRDITRALIDGLILDGRAERALEIMAEARASIGDDNDEDLLLREARAHQRLGHDQIAVESYVRLANAHLAAGERQLAAAAYEQALRIDPRREIARALAATRRTRAGAAIRIAAATLAITMIAAMGWIWLDQHHRTGALRTAMDELEAVLATGDHAAARRALARWDTQLSDQSAFQDLESRVAFAESAQSQREAQAARAATAAQMQDAAETLAQGQVRDAIAAYGRALAGAQGQEALAEIASRRLRSLAENVQQATSRLALRLPPEPSALLDPSELRTNFESLQAEAPAALLRAHDQLTQIHERGDWPAFLHHGDRAHLETALEASSAHMSRIRALLQGYENALRRAERHRALDPIFREAAQREEQLDFARARTLYAELANEAADPDVRAHFAARAESCRNIAKLLLENGEAAAGGDYTAALTALTQLRRLDPTVSWDAVTSLPLMIRSTPTGAAVTVDGKPIGNTPAKVLRTPGEEVTVSVTTDGYLPAQQRFSGAARPSWDATLALRPSASISTPAPVEADPVELPGGDVLLVDRRGCITRRSGDFTEEAWRTETGDLSGLLTRPALYEDLALVGSIDGELRALGIADGAVRWSEGSLPCESSPAFIGETLVVATTSTNLCFLNVPQRRRCTVPLAAVVRHDIVAAGQIACTVDVEGAVIGWGPDGSRRWRHDASTAILSLLATPEEDLLVIQEDGRATLLDSARGRIRWGTTLAGSPIGAARIVGDVALIATAEALLRVRLRDGASLAPITAPAGSWAGPVAAQTRHFVALNTQGEAYVYGVADGELRSRLRAGIRGRVFSTAGTFYISNGSQLMQYQGALR